MKKVKKLMDDRLKPKRIRIIFDVELNTGEYETKFENVSNPGCGMDYMVINKIIQRIFKDVSKQVGISDNNFKTKTNKEIN